jgi:Tropinone reductase 1
MSQIGSIARWGLSGKHAVVTGGSKGIGKACVEELCGMGATVLTCARNASELEACEQDWKGRGYNVHTVVADLSSGEGRQTVVEAVNSLFDGTLHCLINNVGTNIRKRAIEYSESEYDTIMQTNLKSAFTLTMQLYPTLCKAGGGSVVNIGSVAGTQVVQEPPHACHYLFYHAPLYSLGGCNSAMRSGVIYAMTKAALAQMGSNLSVEWAKDKIRVNTIAPWYIDTPLVQPVLQDPALLQTVLQRTPMGRVGQPSEVSSLAAFFCLDSAAFITGQVVAVDGGYLRNGFF